MKVLQILKSTATSKLTKNHYNNSSSDPSQNPSLLLSQLAGGPSKNYKSSKKMMMPLSSSSTTSRLGSFSSVAVSSSTSASNFPTISNKIKSKNNFNATLSTLDDEAFPSLIKGKQKDSVNVNVNVRGTSDNINISSNNNNNNTANNSNAFFAPSDRDQLESFMIGDEIKNNDEEIEVVEANEQSAVDTLKKKKTKKVVFRYGQKWDI